ncbi:bolA-like protein 3 isoform X2 [Anopheles arabiensis]|uniref:bolA-like protein 3 isoform X2 n=1 Tax=Anopheles arabiensis TaxID=7173 RepID=UPI001AACF456|nr:bolA-like protein 3 isoform X2 [Anopheles arabiensis]XP_040228869.1 bolA-like protein 3 isoform X2 [Anopheles coluzzii]XP_041768576.1 bolA-like protein 3 isoform X3 [Anopheles merus]XP_061507183.1 bolA-like protein 3 isoform X2 [Anopheles gambiae]
MQHAIRKITITFSSILSRVWSGNSQLMKNSEATLRKTLEAKFPQAKNIVVSDISGGCGSMYEIYVESKEFKGLSTVKQHRLITETLKSEIKDMHGLRIHTSIAE